MKKIASFIVNKRYIVLGIMLALCIVSVMLIPKVNINTDMTKYLPEDSSMGMGIDIMAEEFPNTETPKTIRVMFKGLSDVEKTNVKLELGEIENVDSVTYNPDTGNKEDYTLYTVNTSCDYGTQEMMSLKDEITATFDDYEMVCKDDNTTGADLPLWVICVAFGLLMLVLIVMCSSWFEPVLFLATIGVAIGLNMGTNVIFEHVSQMTFSIAAILQVVLSMDYSIILMNRYRQEKAKTENKYDAMKEALVNSFSSVTSSGMTTVIGLLMLIFMSFTIGMDLGLVLAKGVIFSMLCVFTVLPVLILIFDKVLEKSRKKELHIPFGKVASFSYKGRKIIAVVFVVLFVGTYFLQNMTDITYTISTEDEIAEVFPTANPVVMLYENKDEDKIAPIAYKLEEHEKVNSILGYSTTLGRSCTTNEMVTTINSLGADMGLDPSLLSVLYYDKYAGDAVSSLTLSEVLNFISEKVVPNKMFASYIDDTMKDNMGMIEKFADKDALTKKMSAKEIADLFSMGEEEIKQVFTLYFAENSGVSSGTMTMEEFGNFVVNEVANNEMFASFFDEETKSKLGLLEEFCDKEAVTKPIYSSELSKKLGIEESIAKMLYAYYFANDKAYTPSEINFTNLVKFIESDILSNPMFKSYFDKETASQFEILSQFADKKSVQTPRTASELAQMLGVEESMINGVFTLRFGIANGKQMSMEELVDFIISDVAGNPLFSSQVDEEMLSLLTTMQKIIDAVVSGEKLSYTEVSDMLGIEKDLAKILFSVYDFSKNNVNKKLSLHKVLTFLGENKEMFSAFMNKEELGLIDMGSALVSGVVSGKEYTAEELATIVGVDSAQLRQLFMLYISEHGDTSNWKISIQSFVNFIVSDIMTNPDYSSFLEEGMTDYLVTAKTVIDGVVSGEKFTSSELAEMMAGFSEQLDENTMSLMYLYYSAVNNSDAEWRLTIQELFDHLYNNMLEDERFSAMIDDATREQITGAKTQLEDGLSQMRGKNYSLMMIDTTLPVENAETSKFIEEVIKECDEKLDGKYYLIGNSPMSYEMSQSFDKEMLLITLLTAIAIFFVVAITFRSISIPLILVLIVQMGVYVTVAVTGFMGNSMYYLAYLIVQCILMGATIDYGILFTNYYRENRKTKDIRESLKEAFNGSTHTVFTSGLIMVFVTGVLGFAPIDPTISQICLTVSIGALSACLLILFILPGVLAAFDKLTSKDKKKKKVK
ncbi:MAG: hypothetical protein E7555_06840 [Ruminococcaceae bacterium]|nr:hypothetical protein [Oscillospiraceae bacterium]